MVTEYAERPPVSALAGVVRTMWRQRTGAEPYVRRHLPAGGVETHLPLGGTPQLTGPAVEVIPAHTTIVGVRFLPGAAPPLPAVLTMKYIGRPYSRDLERVIAVIEPDAQSVGIG